MSFLNLNQQMIVNASIRVTTFLGQENVIVTTGFLYGIIDSGFLDNSRTESSDLLESPLTALFNCAFTGFIYSLGASIVASLLQPELRFMVPVVIGISVIYRTYKKAKNTTD